MRRERPRTVLFAVMGVLVVCVLVGLSQTRRMDEAVHELFYRQTVTRMETLGRLYRDPLPTDSIVQLPFRPGAAIALTDAPTGWVLTGLVDDSSEPGFVTVNLTDDTSRRVSISDVVLLQDARIPTVQLFTWLAPSALAVFAGLPTTTKAANLVWIPAALAWDGLVVVGILGVMRSRLPVRDWLFPLCVIGGTIAALIAIPGDPGNAERHRATQTVPLLLVLASGLLASRALASCKPGRPVKTAASMPAGATTAVGSSTRSVRGDSA